LLCKWIGIFNISIYELCTFLFCYKSELFALNAGNHTIAAIQTTESYDNLQQSLANIINDVNHLQDQGYIYVDGLKIKLELFLGGDYKVNWFEAEYVYLVEVHVLECNLEKCEIVLILNSTK